ncbi:alpha/beta hydrolase [Dyella sp. AD56]|uniref:alpha/beta fold hydrolase n=1 Tax=Dyella sp. AD56 TaxID=1528744 RepID=UPI0018EB2A94|nr:alpha/beta hydrolase [Dyella sp. AD56]
MARSFRFIDTPVGTVRVYDSGTTGPCVVMVPDGPNVIEHYDALIHLLSRQLRVVCFDMPGFGYSSPNHSYEHSLDQGARAVLGVLDGLGIAKATLAFSCANGFYALRAAKLSPERVSHLFLSQTPSLTAMHAWTTRVIPRPLRIPVIGQIAAWLFRQRAAASWYGMALPRTTDPTAFREKALHALSTGANFCLAGVVQGLAREKMASLCGTTTPCTMIWGEKDHSHRCTDPKTLHECVPQADIVHFQDCGHFPDIEQPERFAELLIDRAAR